LRVPYQTHETFEGSSYISLKRSRSKRKEKETEKEKKKKKPTEKKGGTHPGWRPGSSRPISYQFLIKIIKEISS